MSDNKIPKQLDLRYQQPSEQEAADAPRREPHTETGSSSLYGLYGKNITFHTQGAVKKGYFSLLWHWAWHDLGKTFLGILRVFMPSRNK